ncbi:MAG TPA: tripartite tricarboxylate transporter substrate binding protein [Burkholderiales bacterium]|nr:tripartite tricarboxylate transporter substrate binding protein [Burkholderiales bacterium]
MKKLYIATGAALICAAVFALPASAQNFPAKPVRLIVPFPAGGGVDIVARLLTPHLSQRWGQQVIVDNRPGAGATIGADIAAKSVPDGYTLILANTAHAINATLFRKLPYDAVKDFQTITLVATQPSLLVVHPSVPVKSVKELIALAKAKPNQLNYASSGNGTPPHLSGAMFSNMAGVQMTHVPYKGAAPALNDLLGGQVQLMFATIISVGSHVQSGRVRALAVTSAKRSAVMPNLPTVAEAGVPGFEATAWFMLLAPAKTPAAIVEQVHSDTVAVLNKTDLKERFAKQGAEVVGDTPAQSLRYLKAEITRWGKVVTEANIRPE